MTVTSDQFGEFQVKAKASKEAFVEFIAQKEGYETYEADFRLGNTTFQFTMKRKKS